MHSPAPPSRLQVVLSSLTGRGKQVLSPTGQVWNPQHCRMGSMLCRSLAHVLEQKSSDTSFLPRPVSLNPTARERETQAVYFQRMRRPDQRGEAASSRAPGRGPTKGVFSPSRPHPGSASLESSVLTTQCCGEMRPRTRSQGASGWGAARRGNA